MPSPEGSRYRSSRLRAFSARQRPVAAETCGPLNRGTRVWRASPGWASALRTRFETEVISVRVRRQPASTRSKHDAGNDPVPTRGPYLGQDAQLAHPVAVDPPPTSTEPVPLTIGQSVFDRSDRRARAFLARQPLVPLACHEPDGVLGVDAEHADGLDLPVDERAHLHPDEHTQGVRQLPSTFVVREYPNAERERPAVTG